MAAPGAAIGSPVFDTSSLIPLVERVSTQLDLRKQREQERQDNINKEWTDMLSSMSYQGLDPIQNKTVSSRDDEMINRYIGDVKKYNGAVPDEVKMGYLREQNKNRAARDRMLAANENIKYLNTEIKGKEYYLQDKIRQDAFNKLHVYDEKTGIWVGRDDVNPDEVLGMLDNPDYIDGYKFFKQDLNDIEKVTVASERKGSLGSVQQISTEYKPNFWKTKANGLPERDSNGNPILNLEYTSEYMTRDPQKRKIYQALAERENKTLGEYAYDLMTAFNKPSERITGTIRPYASGSRGGGGGTPKSTNQNLVILNDVAEVFKQSDRIIAASSESNMRTPEGHNYLDVTNKMNYALGRTPTGKLEVPNKVLIDPAKPGVIFIQDKPGAELREIPETSYGDMIAKMETFNPRLTGITDLGVENKYFSRRGEVNLSDVQGGTSQLLGSRREFSQKQRESYRNLREKYPALRLRGKETYFKALRELPASEANKIQTNLNADLAGVKIYVPNAIKEEKELNSNVADNITFEVKGGKGPRIKVFSGEKELYEFTPEQFESFMKSDQLVLSEQALEGREIEGPLNFVGE